VPNAKLVTLLSLGPFLALALAIPALLWVPYDNTGTPDAANAHFLALAVTVLDVLAPFAYSAYRMSAVQPSPANAAVVAGYFLALNALVTAGLLLCTYFGLSYGIFWSAQALTWALVAILWFAGNLVAESASAREDAATVVRLRRQGLIDGFEDLTRRYPAGDDAARNTLFSLAARIIEELRYYPTQELPASPNGPFARVAQWRLALESYLAGQTSPGPASVAPTALIAEAGAVVSSLADYKR